MLVSVISGCGIVSTRLASRLINVETFGFTERMAFRWVQKYICEFGGDPEKVTM